MPMISSLPNLLTLSRIFVIPALIGTFFFVEGAAGNWLSLGLFAAAGITDFLDGYLARQWGIQTRLGRFLDPVADKLLVVAVILLLIAFDRIAGWTVLAAIVIVFRDILGSGLREFLAEIRVGMPVSALAKWKTTVQILALGFLLAGEAGDALLPSTTIGTWGLWIAAALTLYTGYDYLRAGLDHMRHEDDGGGGESGSP